MTQSDDPGFLRRLRSHDESAFRRLVVEHQTRVFNLCYRLLGSREEAEDVAQEVFVTVFKTIGGFRGDSQLSTWIYRITANHAKNRIRYLQRRRAEQKLPLQDAAEWDLRHPAEKQPDHALLAQEQGTLIDEALARLDEDQRTLLILRDLEDVSYEDLAEILDMPLGTIKSRLHRARSAFREALERVEKRRSPR